MAEIWPAEGLDIVLEIFPRGGTNLTQTFLTLFTAFTASTVGTAGQTGAFGGGGCCGGSCGCGH